MTIIKAICTKSATIAAELSFIVRIIEPAYLPPRFYSISMYQLLAVDQKHLHQYVYEILRANILQDYNTMIEDQPILDMMDNPEKYKTARDVELIYKEVEGAGFEPATRNSSGSRSTI